MGLPFTGNTNSSAVSESIYGLPMQVDAYSVVNVSGGAVTINVYKLTSDGNFCIAPNNKALATGEIYESVRPVVLLATQRVMVEASGSVDYDFVINNIQPPSI